MSCVPIETQEVILNDTKGLHEEMIPMHLMGEENCIESILSLTMKRHFSKVPQGGHACAMQREGWYHFLCKHIYRTKPPPPLPWR